MYNDNHLELLGTCMEIFHHEYNQVWTGLMEKLENR